MQTRTCQLEIYREYAIQQTLLEALLDKLTLATIDIAKPLAILAQDFKTIFPPTKAKQTGNIYIVYNADGWNTEYELLQMMHPKEAGNYAYHLLTHTSFRSAKSIEELVESHVARFSGEINRCRMGDFIAYKTLTSDKIEAIQRFYEQRDAAYDVMQELQLQS